MGTPGRANKRPGAGSYRRGLRNPACSSHLPHSTLYGDYVSCSWARSALEHRTLGPTLLICVPARQKLGLVEAQNSVPSIWAPGAEGASGATGYAKDLRDPWGRFLLWDSERGREVMREG